MHKCYMCGETWVFDSDEYCDFCYCDFSDEFDLEDCN